LNTQTVVIQYYDIVFGSAVAVFAGSSAIPWLGREWPDEKAFELVRQAGRKHLLGKKRDLPHSQLWQTKKWIAQYL